MTIEFYECKWCHKMYEYYQPNCDWCASPIEKRQIDNNKVVIYEWSSTKNDWVEVAKI